MDVERTIEFLLEQQVKTETRLDSITSLLQQGMRLLVSVQEAQQNTERHIDGLVAAQLNTEQRVRELAEAQKVTEQKLQSLLDTLRDSRNGH